MSDMTAGAHVVLITDEQLEKLKTHSKLIDTARAAIAEVRASGTAMMEEMNRMKAALLQISLLEGDHDDAYVASSAIRIANEALGRTVQ